MGKTRRREKIEPFEWSEFSEAQINSMMSSQSRLNIWEGSVRSGKTIASIVRWIEYIKTGPKGDLLMVGKTERTLKRNILDLIERIVGTRNYHYAQGNGELFLFGRKIYVVGANDERSENKIRGMTLAGAYGDEATLWPSGFWKMLLTRLSVKDAKLFATTNPDSPGHWLMVDYLERDDLDMSRFSFVLDDNLSLDPDYVASLKKEFTGVFYQRFILGRWVLAAGLIYDMFDRKKHVIEKIPAYIKPQLIGIDFGTNNPTTFILVAERDDVFYIVKEYVYNGRKEQKKKTVKTYSKDLQKFMGDIKPSIYIDPSATPLIAQLEEDHIFPEHADNSVLDGIQTIGKLLENGQLFIHESCKETIKEFESYIWDEKASKKGEDKPVKDNDHCLDALRYAIHTSRGGVTYWTDQRPVGW